MVQSIASLRKVERGIYRSRRDNRWEIFARVAGRPLAHRRLAATLTLHDVRDERAKLRRDLQGSEPAASDGLRADVRAYLPLLAGNARLQRERAAQLAFWVACFGDRPRASLTTLEIQRVLADWAAAGFAYYTIKHRRGGLLALFVALDAGADRKNPVAATTLPLKKPDPEPRGLPVPVVLTILGAVSDQGGVVKKGKGGRAIVSAARVRIHCMAFTGLRPEELKRYRPTDRRRATHELVVHGAKGSVSRVIRLMPEAERWLDELEAIDAIGDFDNGVVQRAFRRALCRVGLAPALPRGTWSRAQPRVRRRALPGTRSAAAGKPKGRTGLIRPYDLRHSFLTAAYEQSGDLTTVQKLSGHKDIRMTQRYAANAVPAVQRQVVERMAAAFAAASEKLPEKVTATATSGKLTA